MENDTELKTADHQLALLRANRAAIIADLDVTTIIPVLLEQLVLSHDDKQRIEHEITLKDKSNQLLKILETKASSKRNLNAIPIFIDSLRREYEWLYKLLTETDVPDSHNGLLPSPSSETDDNIFESPKHFKVKTMLEAGGVSCPLVAVERKQLVQTVRHELKHLRRNNFLVLQGMAGCGKSILAQQSLNSAWLIKNVFPDGVYLLAIGKECSESKDGIMSKIRILCDKLEETRAPVSLEHGAEMLRVAFLKRPKALLVLDGVWRSEVIRSFDVGCAAMVTTRDISIMDVVQGRAVLLPIDSGFSEMESLELFRRTLNLEEIPEAARSIHHTSKGSPMVVSLISSLIQDHPDEVRDEGRWSYYLEALSKRRYSKIRRNRDYEHETIYDAISLSVESLTDKKRTYYSDLALFQDDVPIPCPVLEVLWSLERYEVEDIMKHFVRKSLVGEDLHPSRNWHVYSIHSLQLDYLKYQLQCASRSDDVSSAEQLLHQRFISQYLAKCDYVYDKLPDDDYIFFYIGYHLHKARQYELFPQVYLNLPFIGEKLRLCGPADLLTDCRKYRDFIQGESDERSRFLDEVQSFSELVGYLKFGQEDVDIVQLALQHPNFSMLEQKAREIALGEPSRLYFEWLGADTRQWKNPEASVICSEGVRCAKFVGSDGHLFLAGLNDGAIELCDMITSSVIWRFSGHSDTVTCLATYESPLRLLGPLDVNGNGQRKCSEKLIFLSTSDDSTCKIWTTLNSVIESESRKARYSRRDSSGNNSPSPKLRQSQWTFEKVEDTSTFTFQFHTAGVCCAEFSPSGTQVVSASPHEILVWNVSDGQVLYKNTPTTSPPSTYVTVLNPCYVSCHFGPIDLSLTQPDAIAMPYLLLGTGNQLSLFALHQSSISASVEASNMNIVSVLYFATDWFCVVSEHDIGLWKVTMGESEVNGRRKSLSPRRSFPITFGLKTETDASRTQAWRADQVPQSSMNRFLLPPATLERFTSNGPISNQGQQEGFRSNIKNSASTYGLNPVTLSASIDSGESYVKVVREQILPKRGSGLFQCAAITQNHDDLLLACGTSNMKICLFNLLSYEFLGEFNTHTGLLRCLDFSKVDEWTVLTGCEDRTVMVWDVKEEMTGKKLAQKRPEFEAIFNERVDGGQFFSMFSTDSSTTQFYEGSTLVLETSKLRSDITVVALSPSGTKMAVGTEAGMVYKIELAEDGSKVNRSLSAQQTSTITCSNIDLVADLEQTVQSLKFDPTSSYLVGISSFGLVTIVKNYQAASPHVQFRLSKRNLAGIHFPFGKYVAFVSEHFQGPVTIFDLDSKTDLKGFHGPELGHVSSSALTSDSSCLAVGSRCGDICLLSLRHGVGVLRPTVLSSKHRSAITAVAFSPDGLKMGVGFKNGLVTIWELGADSYTEVQNLVLHKAQVRSLVFSPFEIADRRWLISCGDRLAVWSIAKPAEQIPKSSFMAERRRRRSGDSRPASRMSLELPSGMKIGKQGKRELLNSFSFRGNFATKVVGDSTFTQFVTVDNTGIFYLLRIMKD